MNARELIDQALDTYSSDVYACYDARSDMSEDALALPWPGPESRYVLDALRAAVGGDRVVLQWGDDGEVTLHGLAATSWTVMYTQQDDGVATLQYRLTDVAAVPSLEGGHRSDESEATFNVSTTEQKFDAWAADAAPLEPQP